MEKVVKSEYDETKVKQEMDITSEYVEKVYTVCERSEPASLVTHPMQTNTQNSIQPEDYFFEDVVKSGYDESERKQGFFSIDLPECTEDKYSVAEPTGKPISLDVDSVQININDISLAEDYIVKKLVKSEDNEIEHKQEAASSAVRSKYTVSKPTNELTSLVDPFSSTFQINTQHPDLSEDYVIKDAVKSEYDETEFKQENSSIYLESEEFTEDKYSLIEATSDPIILVMDSIQINTQNVDTSEEHIFEPTVKSQYDEIDHKQEVSTLDFKFEYTQDKNTVADPKNDPILIVDQNPTFQHNSQNADPSEDYNIVKVPYAIQSLDKPVSREISEITSQRFNFKPHRLTQTGKKMFSCDICSKAFSWRKSLKTHQLIHTGRKFSCDVCSKALSTRGHLKRHFFTHTGKKFSCDVCSKSFSQKSNLKQHLLTHTGEKSFSCDVCSKSFSMKSNLKSHQLTHTREKFFSCDVCSKSFSLKRNLKTHLLTHTGEKFFSCDICSKAFSRKGDFKKHMITHTGENFFSCHVCSKVFSQESHFKSHFLTHTGEKFFSCDFCSKSFSHKGNLKAHLLIHTGEKLFSCDICSKAFSRRGYLKTHLHTHTGDKFFSCGVCSKSFSQKSNLKRHELIHTRKNFFSCNVCSESFALRSNLKTHLITHRPTGDV